MSQPFHQYGKRQALSDPIGSPEEANRIREADAAFVQHLRRAYLRGDFPQGANNG